ncbi:MFS transporter [Notoacmeibacter sp. MSK16QG-6]|uniref:MFS transporter n=1 Tax=Notoacmeibacter sp. MSK16QG-6 TaxID=2957982 RepID=UPI00209DD252|nr:MFS transporter [Notoacmeibacter sp. MSK16QG-6]MCP1198105.1 MFS transporter [Notoacmeibacter sp. MSK16QG-6]
MTIRLLVPFLSLFLSAFLMFAAIGLTNLIIPLRAGAEGWGAGTIGLIGMTQAIAFTAACFLMPLQIRRVGHIRTFAAIQTLLAASIMLHGLIVTPWAWALFRIIAGLAAAGSYMVLESWLNEKADAANRGFVLSAYLMVTMTGLTAGQYAYTLFELGDGRLFQLTALLFGAALLPMTLSISPSPAPPETVHLDLKGLFARSPVGFIGAFLSGFLFGVWNYFAPLYGQKIGLSSIATATLVSAAMVGGMLAQFPFGRLSDKIDRRYVMAMIGGVGACVCLVLSLSAPETALFNTIGTLMIGMALFPSYSIAVAHTNDYANPDEFVQVSGSLLITYGIGTMVGPVIGGQLFGIIGPVGLFVSLGMIFLIYGAYAYWRTTQRQAIAPDERDDFQAVPVTPFQTQQVYELDPRQDDAVQAGDTAERSVGNGFTA